MINLTRITYIMSRSGNPSAWLHLIPGASHIDLYYKPDYVPAVAAKLADFFTTHLA